MPLSDVEKKLYTPDGEQPQSSILSAQEKEIQHANYTESAASGWKSAPRRVSGMPQWMKIAIGVVVFLALAAGGLYFYKSWFGFSESKIIFSIAAPNSINSGDTVTYTFSVINNNRVNLTGAYIELTLPSGAISATGNAVHSAYTQISVGNVGSLSEVQKTYALKLVGAQNSSADLKARLVYYADGVSIPLQKQADKNITIASVPVNFNFKIANQVLSGKSFSFTVNYQNNSQLPFSAARIVIDYPQGFVFANADPAPTASNNVWDIGNLAVQAGGSLQISGILSGNTGDTKKFTVSFEVPSSGSTTTYSVYAQSVTAVQISQSPLLLTQTVNGDTAAITTPGAMLHYVLSYKNDYNVAINNVTITAELNGTMFDVASLQTNGIYNASNNTIIWTGTEDANLQSLAPGETGQEQFTIKVKGQYPLYSQDNKNLTLAVNSTIASDNVPSYLGVDKIAQSANELIVKLSTQTSFTEKGYYFDNAARLSNTGPVPPRVGQTTTYTIHWLITNSSNDVHNAKVTAYLMPGVSWTGKTINNFGGAITYNSTTGEVMWNIGTIPASTGYSLPAYEAVFQVSITPAINQVGSAMNLVSAAQFSGTDAFTNQNISLPGSALDTTLPMDFQLPSGGGIVQQ